MGINMKKAKRLPTVAAVSGIIRLRMGLTRSKTMMDEAATIVRMSIAPAFRSTSRLLITWITPAAETITMITARAITKEITTTTGHTTTIARHMIIQTVVVMITIITSRTEKGENRPGADVIRMRMSTDAPATTSTRTATGTMGTGTRSFGVIMRTLNIEMGAIIKRNEVSNGC